MPHVARYFSQRAYDSSFEPCLKKSKVDFSALCKTKTTEEFIPLQSDKGSSPGFSGTRYCGSDKGGHPKTSEDFLNRLEYEAKPGSSRDYSSKAHYSNREFKQDYLALGEKRNTDEYIQLETQAENVSTSGYSRYSGSDIGKHENPGGGDDFLNSLDSQEKTESSRNYTSEAHSSRESKTDYSALCKKSNSVEYVPLETRSEKWSSSGFSETRSYIGKHDKSDDPTDFPNSQEKTESPSKYSSQSHSRRESKPDYSALCKKSNTEEYIPLGTPPSGFSETRSDKGECDKVREDSNKKQQTFRNQVPKTEKWDNNSEAKFSETSTAFIGPLCQPPPKVGSVSLTTHNENSKSPSFRITTVVSGKAANKTKKEDGMNYELGQFYKELYELEAATDDHNISPTTAQSQQSNASIVHQVRDHHGQQDFSSHQSNAPIVYQIRDHSQQDFSSHHSNTQIVHQVRVPHGQQDFSSQQSNAPIVPQVRDHYGQQDFSSYQSNAPIVHQVRDHHSQQDFSSHHRHAPIVHQVRDYHGLQHVGSHQSNTPIVHQVRDHQGQQGFSSHQSNAPMLHQIRDHSQQTYRSHQSNTPTVQQVRESPSQTSQPCNPLPSKPSAPVFPSYHPNGAPVSPAEHLALPPINKPGSCNRPVPFDRTNSSFVNCSLPPPGFRCPPPPAFVGPPIGPPPPSYNYPLIFPRGDNIRNSTYHEKEKYHSVNDNLIRPSIQVPWHSSRVPPENRFSPQGRGHTEPFPRPPLESSQQSYQCDFLEQKGRHFNEVRLPHGDNVPHEQYPPRFREDTKHAQFKGKLVLLRGVPGSGKSTLARFLLDQSPGGIVLSTDDYFSQQNGYAYDVKLLGDAHSWNQNRARRAMEEGKSPIIIDNTNIQGWEMKPYVQMAIERHYGVDFLEPDTWWKLDPHELEKRNTHRVPREKISQMLERFEHGMNVGVVMNAVEPRHVRSRCPPPEDRPRWGASVDCTQHSTSFQIR